MAIDERTRFEMYLGLEQALGTPVADAVMEHLPPVGWADVATKHDLAALEERLGLTIDAAISDAMTKVLMFLLPTMLAAIAVGIAAARLG